MQLAYSRDELLSDHRYQRPHVVRDRAFHGGFDAEGRYVSPRSKRRLEGIRNWGRALRMRGGELQSIDFDPAEVAPYPNEPQLRHLIRTGHDEHFWDLLTDVGRAEARGAVLAALQVPDFREVLADDTREWALGHLGGGLLEAHGLDEGGDSAGGPGAHDRMWTLIRDLSMGEEKHPIPRALVPPPPRTPSRRIPEIPEAHERFLRFLMVVLIIEVRALPFLEKTRARFADPDVFGDRSVEAREAADLVARIRQDEKIHVAGLRAVLGELNHATFLTEDGPCPGHRLLAPVWETHVRFMNTTAPQFETRRLRGRLAERLGAGPEGKRLLDELAALDADH